jgi:hypothetical protein
MTTTTIQIITALIEFFAIVFKSILNNRNRKEALAL